MNKFLISLVLVLSFANFLLAEVPIGFKVIAEQGEEFPGLPPGWKDTVDDSEIS